MKHLKSACLLGVVLSGGVLLNYLGVLRLVWVEDTSWICTLTVALAAVCYVISFRNPKAAWVGSGLCLRAGLFGTVLGFIGMLSHYAGGGREELFVMLQGADVALYTTAVGLVMSTILYLQALFIGYAGGDE